VCAVSCPTLDAVDLGHLDEMLEHRAHDRLIAWLAVVRVWGRQTESHGIAARWPAGVARDSGWRYLDNLDDQLGRI